MGEPIKIFPVKLVVGLISKIPSKFTLAHKFLERKFGKTDSETELLDFSCTNYYEKEFGPNLKRKFFSFKNLIVPAKSYAIKLYTNRLEKKLSERNNLCKRTINIDPGYIALSKLVLFTTKNRSHRIHLDKGIYGDLELQFISGSFHPLDWTYPDYRSGEYINFFNSVRNIYLRQLKRGT